MFVGRLLLSILIALAFLGGVIIVNLTFDLFKTLITKIKDRIAVKRWRKKHKNDKLRLYVVRGLETDGAHHKQYYLEKIAEELKLDLDLTGADYEKGIVS